MVEDLLAARGIIVLHQTIRPWAEKFGCAFANEICRRSSGRLGDKWHLDEAVIANLFHIPRHDIPSNHHRELRAVAMNLWEKIARA